MLLKRESEKTARISLSFKLVPLQYREYYEIGQLNRNCEDQSRWILVILVSSYSIDLNICSFQSYWANTLRGVLSTGERTFREASIIEHAMWATFSAWLSHGFGRPPTTM